jgi:hypothetical protein
VQLDREIKQALKGAGLPERDRAILARLEEIGIGEAEIDEVAREFPKNAGRAREMAKDLGWTDPNLCSYCGRPTRKGSALIDGQTAHKSCIKEFDSD